MSFSNFFQNNDGASSNLLQQTNSSFLSSNGGSSGNTAGGTSLRSEDIDEQERKFDDYPFAFGACLMTRDDNLYLPEWIAYHYTVLPLRYLILSVDPLSWTSPLGIIDSYRQALPDLHITVWTGNHFFYDGRWHREKIDNFDPFNHTPSHGYLFHLQRQRAFYTKCLQEIKKKTTARTSNQAKFVILIDTDEYITFNTPLPGGGGGGGGGESADGASGKTQQPLLLLKDSVPQQIGKQNETLAHWITAASKNRQESYNSRNNSSTNITITAANPLYDALMKNSSLCMVYPKLKFSSIEDEAQQQLHHHTSNTTLLYTMQYQHMYQYHEPGKSFVQLDVYDGKRLVTGIHNPFGGSCDHNGNINPSVDGDYPFRINEYPGSLETFLMRPSRTKETWLARTSRLTLRGRDPVNSLSKWFDHFVHDTLLGGNVTLANQLTIGAKQDAIKEWKNIQERIQQGEKIQPAFPWDRPSPVS